MIIRISVILIVLILIPDNKLLGQKKYAIKPLTTPVIIDGIFEPEIWADTGSTNQFIQMEPHPGKAATEKTAVFLGFDKNNFYAVFKCYQTTPIIAQNQSRDALSKNDDIISLIIDTYNDQRSGYAFFVNAIGTQIDMKINDDGRNIDLNWDAEWSSATKMFDWGWCAEFKIPFKSIKYKKGLESWGINFGRVIRSNFETSYWSGVLSNDFRISQGAQLNGIKTPDSGMQLKIFPFISVFKNNAKKLKADFGGDIQWQISPNISLNGTINPDFATVEADQVKINLTRYELRYPEKRLFFQEGNDMYNTRIRTFYSRRIQDIDFGERLNGKIGKYQFNLLNIKTPNLSSDNPAAFYTAARIKKDVFNSSTIGLTLVDKSRDNNYTRSISLDYVFNFGKTWRLTGQFVGSAPGEFWSHSAWYARFARENNIYHYHFRYNNVGSNFQKNVNQTGFITDDDRKEIDFEGTYKFWIKNNWLEYIYTGSNNNIFWSQAGKLRSWNIDNWIHIYFKNRFNFEYNYNNEFKLYEKKFYNFRHEFSIGYNTAEWNHALIEFTTGKNFDRNFYLINGGIRIKLFTNLALQYSGNYIHFNPDLKSNTTFLNTISANYNFNKDLWLKIFTQSSITEKKIYFYGMVGWRFKPPFGAVYLIYSHDEYLSEVQKTNYSNTVFIKFTYPLTVVP